ncbi:peroxisomal sarcosine oxidase-like [Babylonia areolata]|uniref:peroxisomal sarcosine oxidase-like n=1 Tax=Babylonia areolata TaxID=304850 RepID=UPI003FD32DC9
MAAYDVIVIGAGVEGSSTALHLAKDGQRTLLLEQFPLPHSRGSSHGQSRITRRAYPQHFYSEMMVEATQFWMDLQRFSGVEIYRPIGYLAVGKQGGQFLKENKDALIRTGARFTEMDGEGLRKQYGMLNYPGFGAIFDPDGGVLRSDRILNTFQKLFKSYGGEIRDGQRVLSVTPRNQQSVTVITEQGQLTARSVVLCCGPWTSDLTSTLGLALPLKPVRISVCYWKEKEPGLHSYQKLPTFFDEQCCGGHDVYGLPCDEYPECVKVCLHHGPDIHPDRRDAADHSWVVSMLSDYVREHFPGLEPTPAVVETCIYTNTPDRHFILDTHPTWKNIVIGAGFSGHGFKLAPVVGRLLSQLAQGKDPSYDLSPFRLNRFSPKSQL